MKTSTITKAQAHKLRRLHRLYRRLDNAGGPEKDGELFERILKDEAAVLKLSGLPATAENSSIVQSIRTYEDVRKAIPILQTLLGAASRGNENLAPLEHLTRGISEGRDPANVLPAIGITNHLYTQFVYRLILLGGLEPTDCYNEMIRASDHLEEIATFKLLYQRLSGQNIQFLDAFLHEQDALQMLSTFDDENGEEHTDERVPASATPASAEPEQDTGRYEIHPTDYLGRLVRVNQEEDPCTYVISFVALAMHPDRQNEDPQIYSMTMSCQDGQTIMSPGDELEEAMDLLASMDDPTELDDERRRLWNVGCIADELADRFVRSGVFGNLVSVRVGE